MNPERRRMLGALLGAASAQALGGALRAQPIRWPREAQPAPPGPTPGPTTGTPGNPGSPGVQAWRLLDEGAVERLGPPGPPREFRGLWVASVDNIDWPSRRGLPAVVQQREIQAIVDLAAGLNLNAIVLQVRPACDALYLSTFEPWSEFLTGQSGQAPDVPYDPLAMWVRAAHAKGIQLHAWINPFRARHPKSRKPDAPSHVSRARPELVRAYGDYLWLDPGDPRVHDLTLGVVRDLLTRYDLDALHIDDYFYPYPIPKVEFDDAATYGRYQQGGGKLARDDWRRDNVDRFVERLHREVHATRPQAMLGISPFGIWRPGHPAGVKSMDPYVKIHADARKWLQEGWVDYFAPQLYWPMASKEQPFEPIMDWWIAQNTKGRHVWPGLYMSKVGAKEGKPWPLDEIVRQVQSTRTRPGARGHVLFSAVALVEDRQGLRGAMRAINHVPTLVPSSPWIGAMAPLTPTASGVSLGGSAGRPGTVGISMGPGDPRGSFRWVVGKLYGERWEFDIVPGAVQRVEAPAVLTPERAGPQILSHVAVWASDRLGNLSRPVVLAP